MNLETAKQKYPNIPENTLVDITEFVNHGRPVGSFLTAVLSNDLFEAVNRGDNNNQTAIVDIVKLLWNDAPLVCHGNKDKVNAWISKRGLDQWK